MKNETFKVPPVKPSQELHWLQVIQTIVLFAILAINLYFVKVIWEGQKFAERNRRAVDLVIEKLGEKDVINEQETKDLKEEVKEVSPNAGEEKTTN